MINKCLYISLPTLFTYAFPMQISKWSLHLLLMIMIICVDQSDGYNATAAKADVGFILDLNQTIGKIMKTCISMAIGDFYSKHSFNTVIVPHFRDSSNGSVAAASAGNANATFFFFFLILVFMPSLDFKMFCCSH